VFSCLTPLKTTFFQEELEDAAGLLADGLLDSDLNTRLKTAEPGSYLVLELAPELAWIPWELIWDGEQFLCQRFSLGRQLLKTRRELDRAGARLVEIRSGRGVLVAFGDTSGLPVMEEKQAIEEELNKFRIEYHGKLKADDLLKKLKRDYDILHFAGHGEYKEGADGHTNTGWRCADRTLTRADIEDMSDAAFPFLIFANACDSARTSIRSSEAYITDLYQAFLSRGVPHYIGTIARVPAEASMNFARVFYHQLAAGETIGKALWSARQEFLHKPGSPIWAYYVHYGYPLLRLVLERPIVQSLKGPRQISQEEVFVERPQWSPDVRALVGSSLPPPIDKSSQGERKGRAMDLFDKAERLSEAEVFDEALKVVHQAEGLWPEGDAFYWLEGKILLKLERVPEALKVFRYFVDLDPEMHVSHWFLADALEKAGRLREALASYEKGYLIGLNHLNSKTRAEETVVRDVSWIEPAVRQPHFYWRFVESKEELEALLRGACVRIYPHLSEDELEAEFEKVCEEYKQRPHDKRVQIKLWLAYVYHGRNLQDRGAIDDAIEHFKEFSEIADRLDTLSVRSLASINLGNLYGQKGLTAEALASYEAALREEPTPLGKIAIYSAMASLYVGDSAFNEAEGAIQAAIQVFHTDPGIKSIRKDASKFLRTRVANLYWNWAECRLAAKDYDNALKYNAKTVEFEPVYETEQVARRAVILWLKGDSNRMQQELGDLSQSKKEAILEVFTKWGIPFELRDSP
jgi:tetratricopeptide (TPR) repeat protein